MKIISINLSQTEFIALSSVAKNPHFWAENAVKERCRIAINSIVKHTVEKCLEEGIQLPGSKDEIVELADQRGWLINGLPD